MTLTQPSFPAFQPSCSHKWPMYCRRPHILYFGLAKAAGTDPTEGAPVTVTGEFMGTLAYASPEQTKG